MEGQECSHACPHRRNQLRSMSPSSVHRGIWEIGRDMGPQCVSGVSVFVHEFMHETYGGELISQPMSSSTPKSLELSTPWVVPVWASIIHDEPARYIMHPSVLVIHFNLLFLPCFEIVTHHDCLPSILTRQTCLPTKYK